MLRHLGQNQSQDQQSHNGQDAAAGSQDAAAARVNAGELLSAVRAIEERQHATQRAQAETLTLGEAVEELRLNLSAEELLAEVQAQRQKAGAGTAAHARRAGGWRRPFVRLGLGASLALNALLALSLLRGAGPPVAPPTPLVREVPAAVPLVDMDAGFVLLSSVAEGQTAYADLGTLRRLAQGAPADQVLVSTRAPQAGAGQGMWGVLRRQGAVYARVFVTEVEALKLMNGNPALLFDISGGPSAEAATRLVSVPVARLRGATDAYTVGDTTIGIHTSRVDGPPQR